MIWPLLLFITALLFAEGLIRFSLGSVAPKVAQWHITDYLISDAERVRLSKNFDSELGWTNKITGSHGERKMANTYGHPLLLSFGDSFVYGDEVNDHETWQSQLADHFQKDIYNFGVNGYGLDQAFLRFRKITLSLKAPYFALGLTSSGINRVINSYRKFLFPDTGVPLTKPRFILEENGLLLLPNPVKSKIRLDLLQNKNFVAGLCSNDFWCQHRRQQTQRLKFPYLLTLNFSFWRHLLQKTENNEFLSGFNINLWEDANTTKLVREILRNFSLESKELGGKPLLILFPEKNDVETRIATGRHPAQALIKMCSDLGIHFIDGVQAIAQATKTSKKSLQEFYSPGGHLSFEGNHVIAENVKKLLSGE